ncbi:MAG TPA: apolipoprotein N-acyltransferase [Candidatus Dormibacteraeota bacterium]|nr:apolipoprotein N-acyltransferase [Candidatus Dormibacteraeota bacterium]
MNAVPASKKLERRIILLSAERWRDSFVAAAAGVAMALAFPKVGATWLAPFGAAALFWVWQRCASYRAAALLGFLAGFVFFAISFAWFGTTVGSYLGPFASAVVVLPAGLEALAFIAAGLFAVAAYRIAPPALAPLAAAAGFAIAEWGRSVGVLGGPFAQLGLTQVGTPLRSLGAYIGGIGITWVLYALGAYLADAVYARTAKRLIIFIASLAVVLTAAWWWWPARSYPAPSVRVAAIQGNISQSLKWTPAAFAFSRDRYLAMTREAARLHPAIIALPETVITTALNESPTILSAFSQIAAQGHSTIVVGSLEALGLRAYNALYVFGPSGALIDIYQKRQLVPFAEAVPGDAYLHWVPKLDELASHFSHGHLDSVVATPTLSIAPIICWESVFGDLVNAQVQKGAQLLVISTDDAWFGTSAGPYQHAQAAQMRAIENGSWVLRAAATGVSGIIAPDGTYTHQTALDQRAIVVGRVGAPVGSLFARLGPTRIVLLLAALYVALLALGLRSRRAP